MANKERYTVAQVIEALRKTRGMKGPAATLLKCHRDTVDAYSKRHPTVAAVIAEERESMTDTAELSLARAITKGEAWAVCFYRAALKYLRIVSKTISARAWLNFSASQRSAGCAFLLRLQMPHAGTTFETVVPGQSVVEMGIK